MVYYLVPVEMIDAIRSLLCSAEVDGTSGVTANDVYALLLDAVRMSPTYTIPFDFLKAEAAPYNFDFNPFVKKPSEEDR